MIIFFKTINVNWVFNYSYLAIRLERSASFASLIRLYVNSMNILFGLEECAGRIGNPKQYKSHWWAKQNDW